MNQPITVIEENDADVSSPEKAADLSSPDKFSDTVNFPSVSIPVSQYGLIKGQKKYNMASPGMDASVSHCEVLHHQSNPMLSDLQNEEIDKQIQQSTGPVLFRRQDTNDDLDMIINRGMSHASSDTNTNETRRELWKEVDHNEFHGLNKPRQTLHSGFSLSDLIQNKTHSMKSLSKKCCHRIFCGTPQFLLALIIGSKNVQRDWPHVLMKIGEKFVIGFTVLCMFYLYDFYDCCMDLLFCVVLLFLSSGFVETLCYLYEKRRMLSLAPRQRSRHKRETSGVSGFAQYVSSVFSKLTGLKKDFGRSESNLMKSTGKSKSANTSRKFGSSQHLTRSFTRSSSRLFSGLGGGSVKTAGQELRPSITRMDTRLDGGNNSLGSSGSMNAAGRSSLLGKSVNANRTRRTDTVTVKEILKIFEQSTGNLVTKLAGVILWCTVYVYSTMYFMQRDYLEEDWKIIDHKEQGNLVKKIEGIMLWMVTIEFLIGFYCAENRLNYLLKIQSVTDMVCLGPFIFLITTGFPDYVTVDSYLLKLGWIRFMRLYGMEPILKKLMPTAEEIKIKILSLILELCSITCTFAGVMFFFESHDNEPNNFTTFLDFVYFSIVSLSTVGYGDFSPTQKESRVVASCFICLVLSLVPQKVRRISDLWNTKPLVIGTPPARHQEHLLILGPVQPAMIATFLSEIYGHILTVDAPRHVVLLTPDPAAIQLLREVAVFAFRRYNVRLCARYGDFSRLGSCSDLDVATVEKATAVFMFSGNTRNLVEEDRRCVIRLLTLYKRLDKKLNHVYMQLNQRNTNKMLASNLGAQSVVCLNELKMKMLAKSATNCKGFLTLCSNLLRFGDAHECGSENSAGGGSGFGEFSVKGWSRNGLIEYSRGVRGQVYLIPLPEVLFGECFGDAVYTLYEDAKVIMIGLCRPNTTMMQQCNPGAADGKKVFRLICSF